MFLRSFFGLPMQTIASKKTKPAKKPTREEFERAVAAWLREMTKVVKEHPEDFPNGADDIIFSFDNEIKQDEAGLEVLEELGVHLQKRRRPLSRYSPEMHKVSFPAVK